MDAVLLSNRIVAVIQRAEERNKMELKWWTFGFLGMVIATLSIIYLQLGIDKRGINMDIRRLTASEKALMSSEKVTIR